MKEAISDPSLSKGFDAILTRIEKLDKTQLSRLTSVLDQIEHGSLTSSALDIALFSPQSKRKGASFVQNLSLAALPQDEQKQLDEFQLLEKELASQQASAANTTNVIQNQKQISGFAHPTNYQIVLRVLSTWGHAHMAGLTEIQIYDSDGSQVLIPSAGINVVNRGIGPFYSLSKLMNSNIYTTDDKQMWVCNMPVPPKCLQIHFHFTSNKTIGGIIIWNYNKSLLDSVKGVKHLEIIIQGESVWNGVIQRGCANQYQEYGTEIIFQENFLFKNRPCLSDLDFDDIEEKKEQPIPQDLEKIKFNFV